MQHIGTDPSPSQISRANQFMQYLTGHDLNILNCDLAEYANYLQSDRRINIITGEPSPLSAKSASSHLSTIRGMFQRLLKNNQLRDYLYAQVDVSDSKADKKAVVDEIIERLRNNSDSMNSSVKVEAQQDEADSQHIRLTMPQVRVLLQKPLDDSTRLVGLRDCAMMSLALATGAREGELVAIQVSDLRQRLNGKLALRIIQGKGNKTRLVPYGQFANALLAVDHWLEASQIKDDYVFRSLDRHGNVRDSMTTRAVIKALKRYPIMIDGALRTLTPHDLRRTYAKLLYMSDMDLVSIQKNLGHASIQTTLHYIGDTGAEKRQPTVNLPIPTQFERSNLPQLHKRSFKRD